MKLFKWVIEQRLHSYLEDIGFISKYQSGFRQVKSTAVFVLLRENLEKGTFLKKIRENLENSGNFQTIFTTSRKTQGILLCQISLLSSLGHLATNQTNVLLTGTLTNPVTAF